MGEASRGRAAVACPPVLPELQIRKGPFCWPSSCRLHSNCSSSPAAPLPNQVGPKLPPVELNDDGSLKYDSVMKVGAGHCSLV